MTVVLQRLVEYGITLNLKKYYQFVKSTLFLTFYVDYNGFRPDLEKVTTILERLLPATTTNIRSFLNTASYFRAFITGFTTIALPLYALIRGDYKPSTLVKVTKEI